MRGSLVQLHRRSFPLDLEIITRLKVLLGGDLRREGHRTIRQLSGMEEKERLVKLKIYLK